MDFRRYYLNFTVRETIAPRELRKLGLRALLTTDCHDLFHLMFSNLHTPEPWGVPWRESPAPGAERRRESGLPVICIRLSMKLTWEKHRGHIDTWNPQPPTVFTGGRQIRQPPAPWILSPCRLTGPTCRMWHHAVHLMKIHLTFRVPLQWFTVG